MKIVMDMQGIEINDGKGGTIPALVQLTKRGQIFMLDRRTGKPIADVVEKAVPQEHAHQRSQTQPQGRENSHSQVVAHLSTNGRELGRAITLVP